MGTQLWAKGDSRQEEFNMQMLLESYTRIPLFEVWRVGWEFLQSQIIIILKKTDFTIFDKICDINCMNVYII